MKEPTLEEVLIEVLDSRLASVYTALPGTVTKYYADKQTVDVQIQIKDHETEEDGSVVFRSYPVLPNVPVAFARGGGFFISFPLAPGDHVLLIFCKSAIDQWRAKGKETVPGDLRQHSLTAAVAIPGLYPKTKPLTSQSSTDLVIGFDGGGVIHIKPGGEIHFGSDSAGDSVALASLVFNAISTMLGTGIGATGTQAFAAAAAAWALLAPTFAGMGSSTIKAD